MKISTSNCCVTAATFPYPLQLFIISIFYNIICGRISTRLSTRILSQFLFIDLNSNFFLIYSTKNILLYSVRHLRSVIKLFFCGERQFYLNGYGLRRRNRIFKLTRVYRSGLWKEKKVKKKKKYSVYDRCTTDVGIFYLTVTQANC